MIKYSNIVTLFFILSFTSLLFSANTFAKKRCKPFLEKLHKVQASQRNSYSLKRGESLRGKEDKARDKWWKCENSSLAKFNAKYGTTNKKGKKKTKKAKKVAKQSSKRSAKNNYYYTKLNKSTFDATKKNATFNQDSAIVIKSKFQGDKRVAWLAYYDKPTKCQQPKSMSLFAFCHENKRQQQAEFEQGYRVLLSEVIKVN